MKKLIFTIILVMGISISHSQKIEINPTVAKKIAPGLYIQPARGSYTTIFTGKDGLLIIDTGMEFEGAKSDSILRADFKKPIRYLLNSHSHLDHTGGNKFFAGNETIIIAHENVRKEMQNGWKAPEIFKMRVVQPHNEKSLPDICFSDSIEIHFNNETIKMYHVPDAHTAGDSYVYFQKANAIHTGDIFITLNCFPPFEGSLEGVIKAFDQLIKLCDENTIVIPAHGPVSNREGVIKYKEIFMEAAEIINKLKQEGQSYEEIVAAQPLEELLTGKKYISDNMFIYSVYYGNWKYKE